jgi:hypothetical protein
MLCRQCGADNKEDAVYCLDCKNPLQLSVPRAKKTQPLASRAVDKTQGNTTSIFLTALGILVGMSIGAGGFYLYWHHNDPATPTIIMAEPVAKIEVPSLPPTPVAVPEKTPAIEQAATAEDVQPEEAMPEEIGVMLDPNAPCLPNVFLCVGGVSDSVRDPGCLYDKQIWAYFSNDKGKTWSSAGCYATEAEATKGVTEARRLAALKPSKSESKSADVAEKAKSEPLKADKAKKTVTDKHDSSLTEQAQQASPAGGAQETPPAPATSTQGPTKAASYHVQFKGAFGLVILEERHYASQEMKQKALELWDSEQKILEPDGSINEKYVIKPPKAVGIPGY